jgi:hypothetical protein
VLFSGQAGFDNEGAVLSEQGAVFRGESPFSHTFIHAEPNVIEGLENYGYVVYDKGIRAVPKDGAASLATVGEPYFERDYTQFCGHDYTPESQISKYSAIIQNGKVMTFALPLFETYGKYASPNIRILIGNCIKRLIEPKVTADGTSFMEAVLMESENAKAVHLISFCPERRANGLDIVEDPIPVIDLNISVKCEEKPKKVYLAPDEIELPFAFENGRVATKLSFTQGHAMLMIE